MPKGVYERRRRSPWERFFLKTEQHGDCWLWTAHLTQHGYGWFNPGGRSRPVLAHRWAYEYVVAEIPDGLTLDHLCRNRACVNPHHLEPVPLAVNVKRANPGAHFAARAHCKNGHEYTEANTQIAPNGARRCRTCVNARSNAYRSGLGRQACPWCGDEVTGSVLRRHVKLKHGMDVTAAEIRSAQQRKV